MKRNNIALDDFNTNIFKVLNKEWMLLSGGDYSSKKYNFMTISWGFMGTMWFKPVIMVGLRPQRHTLEFIEKYDTFTISAFSEDHKAALAFCGAHSGRDCDKAAECGLTPTAAKKVDAPAFKEAELVIECRKLYHDQLKAKNFNDKSILSECYPNRDLHIMFTGEVVNIAGIKKYINAE
ncbi:MAG: flavin reductase family protein [Victivallaceae bacterium]|nr:flavin reductase family protein [Victivallaceae bacterium]